VLQEILSRLSRRDHPRTEAEVQADVRQFILEAPFDLEEGDLDIVSLESPVTGGRRIDVEVGSAVIEVKRDLRRGRVLEEAVQQLGGYLRTRTSETGRRYVGVLTDVVEWRCYALAGEDLKAVSTLHVATDPESLPNLVFWLEGVLATATNIAPTAKEIEARLGANSSAYDAVGPVAQTPVSGSLSGFIPAEESHAPIERKSHRHRHCWHCRRVAGWQHRARWRLRPHRRPDSWHYRGVHRRLAAAAIGYPPRHRDGCPRR
jgi:hypothetical protein